MTTIKPGKKKKLIHQAIAIRSRAYAPYSKYKVGAALLGNSGKIYVGVNVENAAYPTGICAERSALFTAVTKGEKKFQAIAVVTENGGSPCGACRQALAEFGLDLQVLLIDRKAVLVEETTLRDLLPGAFTPSDLKHAAE